MRALAAAGLLAAMSACAQMALLNLAVPAVSVFAGRTDNTTDKRIAELQAKGDWRGILVIGEDGIKRQPDNGNWWFIAGYAHSQLGELPRAIECYSTATRLNPEDIKAWNQLGRSYREVGDPQRAVQTLERASIINTTSVTTLVLLGESYGDINLHTRAIGAFQQAIQLDKASTVAWYGLGLSYAKLGRRDELQAVLQRLQALDPALADELARRTGSR